MKRKLLLLLCSLLSMLTSVQEVKADVVKTDVTDAYITNPSFENDAADAVVTGWTAYGHSEEGLVDASSFPVTSAEDFVNKDGDKICKFYANRWTGWWSYWIIYQKATLPAGVYELDATIEADAGKTVSLFALPEADLNNKDNYINKTDVTGTDGNTGTKTSVTFTSNGSTPVVLGAGLIYAPSYYPFTFKVDNFKLYSLKNIDYTSLLANPSFETGNKDGWTDDTAGRGTPESKDDKIDVISTDALPGKEGTYFAERWWHDSYMNIHQTTQTLPGGFYRITALAKAEAGEIVIFGKAGSGDEVTQSVGEVGDYSLEVYLATSGTIKLGLKGNHNTRTHVAFDNFRLTYLGNPKAALTTLQGTIDESYLNNSDYANVAGEERTALTAAKTLTAASETAAAYEAAVASVQEAIDNFVAAKTNYDALASVNAKITAVGTLEYASSAKKPSTYDATSSSDAASHATSLTTALRAYVESNALGEGVDGATDCTSYIGDAICPANPTTSGSGDRIVITGTGWSIDHVRANTGAGWTDSEGAAHQPYYDSNGEMYNGYTGITTASMSQTVSNLPAGKYLLTVATRSSGTLETFYISGNGVQQAITTSNNIFGNGWDDTSVEFTVGAAGTAEIVLYGKKAHDYDTGRWFSADNFRLARLGDATVSATIGTAGWTTFASPYALNLNGMTASEGDVKAYYASSMGDGKVTMTSTSQVGVQAGEGLMLKGNAGATITIPIEPSGTSIDGNKMKGCLVNTEITSATENYATFYVLVNGTDGAEFQNIKKYCDGGHTVTVPAGKAYLDATALAGARLTIVFNEDGFTGINAVEAAEAETGALKDGKYLINGKIVLVKNGVKYGANGQKLN